MCQAPAVRFRPLVRLRPCPGRPAGVAADTSAGVGVAPASPTIERRAAGGLRPLRRPGRPSASGGCGDRLDLGSHATSPGPEGHAFRRTPRRRSRLLYSPFSASPLVHRDRPDWLANSASAMQPAPQLSPRARHPTRFPCRPPLGRRRRHLQPAGAAPPIETAACNTPTPLLRASRLLRPLTGTQR